MVHSDEAVVDWLREHCQHDRVLYNALNNHQHSPTVRWMKGNEVWKVSTWASSGQKQEVYVSPHLVTGEPHRFYRVKDGQTATI